MTCITFYVHSCTLYNQERNRLFNELLKKDQIDIIDNYCLFLGKEILPESRNKKILLLYTTMSEIQAGLTNM